ncbi:MAG: M28 family peptidase [Lentisphaeria bacterium]
MATTGVSIGSAAYASAAKARGDTIRGMISLDMIAYNTAGKNTAEIYGRTTSDTVKLALAEAVKTYGGLTPTVFGQLDYSDHASFEANGYPAALLIEADGNPYYHTATVNVNTPNYIDYQFATNMTKGTVGYVASVAILVPEPGALWLLVFAAGVVGKSRRSPVHQSGRP